MEIEFLSLERDELFERLLSLELDDPRCEFLRDQIFYIDLEIIRLAKIYGFIDESES